LLLLLLLFAYASVWYSITFADANKTGSQSAVICSLFSNRFLPDDHYSYVYALEQLKLRKLRKRRLHLDALFVFQVYLDSMFCPSLLETGGLRVPARQSDALLCPLSASPDALQQLVLFAGTLPFLETQLLFLIVF
jgi:hypothetical protein